MEIEKRIRRMYAAVAAGTDDNISGIKPTAEHRTARSYGAHYDFSNGASAEELENDAHTMIYNVAHFKDHARKWLRSVGKDPQIVEDVVTSSEALGVLIDLSNFDKHAGAPRDGGYTRREPRLVAIKRHLRLSTQGGTKSAVSVVFSRSKPPQKHGDGRAAVVLSGEVIDKGGRPIGFLDKLVEDAVTDWERFLTAHGVTLPVSA